MRHKTAVGSGEYKKLDEKTKMEIREMDSVLGDFFGLGMVLDDYGRLHYAFDGIGCGLGIVSLEDGSGRGWWYGETLDECFRFMMNDLKREGMYSWISLPVFGSVSELRMKMELKGK